MIEPGCDDITNIGLRNTTYSNNVGLQNNRKFIGFFSVSTEIRHSTKIIMELPSVGYKLKEGNLHICDGAGKKRVGM